jgi:hypothetical protein
MSFARIWDVALLYLAGTITCADRSGQSRHWQEGIATLLDGKRASLRATCDNRDVALSLEVARCHVDNVWRLRHVHVVIVAIPILRPLVGSRHACVVIVASHVGVLC